MQVRKAAKLRAVLFMAALWFVVFWIVLTFLGIRRFAGSDTKAVETGGMTVSDYCDTTEWDGSVDLIADELSVDRESAERIMQLIYDGYESEFGYPCYALSAFEAVDGGVLKYRAVSSESVAADICFNPGYTKILNIKEGDFIYGDSGEHPGEN